MTWGAQIRVRSLLEPAVSDRTPCRFASVRGVLRAPFVFALIILFVITCAEKVRSYDDELQRLLLPGENPRCSGAQHGHSLADGGERGSGALRGGCPRRRGRR